jgi:hypothetical protein
LSSLYACLSSAAVFVMACPLVYCLQSAQSQVVMSSRTAWRSSFIVS